MTTFDLSDLAQARNSCKVQQAIALGARLTRGMRLGAGDNEIDLLEMEGMGGVLIVDNADCQWADYSFAEASDLINTDDLKLYSVKRFRRDGDMILCDEA